MIGAPIAKRLEPSPSFDGFFRGYFCSMVVRSTAISEKVSESSHGERIPFHCIL